MNLEGMFQNYDPFETTLLLYSDGPFEYSFLVLLRFGFVDFESIEVCKAVKESVVDLQIDGSKVTLIYATPQGERGPRGEGAGFNRSFRGKPGGRGGGRGRGRGGGFRGGRGGEII